MLDGKSLLREPLLHFGLIGAALFVVFDVLGKPAAQPGGTQGNASAQVVVSRDAVEQVIARHEKTWLRPPTEQERTALVEDLVKNEIYYREAVAIGLDRADEVLKRRLRQKMEFIFEDVSSWAEPTDAALEAFMKERSGKYRVDPQVAFRQVFVNATARGAGAEAAARQALAQLQKGADPASVGDSTMLASEIPLSPAWDVEKQFGSEFSRSVLAVEPGRWAGPLRSGYGLHLVFVQERRGGRLPELKEVREAVKRDWVSEHQKKLKDDAYAQLRQRYRVTVEQPAAPVSTASTAVRRPEGPR